MTDPPPEDFLDTLYGRDGMRLAGSGPEFTPALNNSLPFKVVLRHHREASEGGQLGIGDRLWLLPDALGTHPSYVVRVDGPCGIGCAKVWSLQIKPWSRPRWSLCGSGRYV